MNAYLLLTLTYRFVVDKFAVGNACTQCIQIQGAASSSARSNCQARDEAVRDIISEYTIRRLECVVEIGD